MIRKLKTRKDEKNNLYIIRVEFILEPYMDNDKEIREYAKRMPWLDYLITNCDHYKSSVVYEPATMQHIVTFNFHICPKKKTCYLLKYSH